MAEPRKSTFETKFPDWQKIHPKKEGGHAMQNFIQHQFATRTGFETVLAPIRGSLLAQLEDAINPVIQIAVANKVTFAAQNTDHITHINSSRAYNVVVDSENGEIWYSLRPGSKARYYYPIQYARITVAVAVQAALM
jgi:1-deoxy-D-xylulose 5-phosphate reductoisomerase